MSRRDARFLAARCLYRSLSVTQPGTRKNCQHIFLQGLSLRSTARQNFVLDVLISEPAAIPDVLAVDPSFSFCVLSFLKIPINRFQSPRFHPSHSIPCFHIYQYKSVLRSTLTSTIMPWVEVPAACAGSRNIVTCSGQFATAGEAFIVSLHVSSGLTGTRPDHLCLHLPEFPIELDAAAKNAHSMYSTTSSPAY